jgi:hypothetical protein
MHRPEFPGGRVGKRERLRGRKGKSCPLAVKEVPGNVVKRMGEIKIRGVETTEHGKQRSERTTRQPMIY